MKAARSNKPSPPNVFGGKGWVRGKYARRAVEVAGVIWRMRQSRCKLWVDVVGLTRRKIGRSFSAVKRMDETPRPRLGPKIRC